ncbi:NeuD/PglB/VioB family sugar acetyltransferase [candidate division KSB1 bacterium]|nr:NeuD/PglB/VioB family sugar acetyltransferase [candidate division KSB1 bacterium]
MNSSSLKPLFIYGAGGFAREVTCLVDAINRITPKWRLQGYITDNPKEYGREIYDTCVLGAPEEIIRAKSGEEIDIVLAMGTPKFLHDKPARLRKIDPAIDFPALVHPKISLDMDRIRLGEGNIIAEGNLFTTDINIGNFNVINLGCVIAHDVVIENYCVLGPRAIINGEVKIESGSTIGAGAVILQGVAIGKGAVVAIGAVVGMNVEPYAVVAGNPARKVRCLAPED